MTEGVLFIALVAEAAAVLVSVLTLIGFVAMRRARCRRYEAPMEQARLTLRAVALADAPPDSGADALRVLPLDLAITVLHELARSVSGESLVRLRSVAAAAGITARAERLSQDLHWWRRLRGVRLLTELRPDTPVLLGLLDDAHPAVRAVAAAAVATDPSPCAAARLLGMLDDPDQRCRFSAKTALLRAGSSAVSPLRAYLEADRVARPAEALEVAVAVADHSFLGPAMRLSAARNPVTRRAAAAVLARAAGEGATQRITELLEDPDSRVRAEAARGLGDLRHWPAAPALSRALSDPTWDVRSAAAIALLWIGAPGRMYLREALRSVDPFAADIARQVLSLPQGAMSLTAA